MNERVELRTVLAAVRHRRTVAVLVFLATVAVALVATALMPRVYASTTSVLVGETIESSNVAREDIQASQELASTYTDLARRQPVLEKVVDALGLEDTWLELRDRVQVNLAQGNGQLIVVTAHAGSAREANQIARGVTDQLIQLAPKRVGDPNVAFVTGQLQQLQAELRRREAELAAVATRKGAARTPEEAQALQSRADTLVRQISDLQGNYSDLRDLTPRGGGTNFLRVLEPASSDPDPIRPNLDVNLAVAALVGILLAGALCYYLEFREPRPVGAQRRAAPGDRPGGKAAHARTAERERSLLASETYAAAGAGSTNGAGGHGLGEKSARRDRKG